MNFRFIPKYQFLLYLYVKVGEVTELTLGFRSEELGPALWRGTQPSSYKYPTLCVRLDCRVPGPLLAPAPATFVEHAWPTTRRAVEPARDVHSSFGATCSA